MYLFLVVVLGFGFWVLVRSSMYPHRKIKNRN
jgi:hypothetical protein